MTKLKAPRRTGQRIIGVPTWEVAAILERALPEIQAGLTPMNNHHRESDDVGAIQVLAERISMHGYTAKPDSVCRRIWALRQGEQHMANLHFVDCLMLSIGESLYHAGLAILPGSQAQAKEMVEVHHELHPDGSTKLERTRLARSLKNFAHGYTFCDSEIIEVADEEPAEDEVLVAA